MRSICWSVLPVTESGGATVVSGAIVFRDIVSVGSFRTAGCGSVFQTVVIVIADVEVEMKEARAELAVSMPIAEGVQTQPASTDDDGETDSQPGEAGKLDHGSAEASHRDSGPILLDPCSPAAATKGPVDPGNTVILASFGDGVNVNCVD